ncbi:uncharacterized protein [Nicotiana sylvestris]|uniref:uncharacterized protein n=1 Tax=Nicotiana sylvestris TaxID=4096 RepID=UPI00388CE37E
MEKDCFSFVRKCHQCKVHGDLIHALPSELHHMSAPWPFVAWGIDVIGTIETKSLNRHRFILVAIDYFTIWVEAVTFKAITKKAVVEFVHSNIIFQFGIPKTIITNNAANLNSHLMREVCKKFKITHCNSTPYRPKANGTVEATNKNIKKILRKIKVLDNGIKTEIKDDEWVKTQLEQLTMINEKWMAAVCHGQLYQQRMARAYDKKVQPRNFEVGKLVLRRIIPHHEEAKGKCSPNWKGPYIVRKLLLKRALYLGDIEGNDPKTAVNADAVKRHPASAGTSSRLRLVIMVDASKSKLLEGDNQIEVPIKANKVEKIESHVANRLGKGLKSQDTPNALKLKLEERSQK